MFTIGQIRELIKDLPDDTLVLQNDSFSNFAFNILDIQKGYTKLTKLNYHRIFNEKFFEKIKNNPDNRRKEIEEYKPCLLITTKIEEREE